MTRVRRTLALIMIATLAVPVWPGDAVAAKARPAARTKARTPSKLTRARATNVAPPGVTDSERKLQAELDGLLASRTFAGTRTAVYAVDVTSGRVLYSYAADDQLNPASNMKLLSTATALDLLGPDFRYATRLVGPAPDAAGVVQGDVWLQGMGDPTLTDAGLAAVAASARARGLTRVTGKLLASTDGERDGLGRPRLTISVRAGERDGDPVQVEVRPDSAYVVIDSDATTSRTAKVSRKCRTVKQRVKGKLKRKRVCGPTTPAGLAIATSEHEGPAGTELVVRVTGKIRPAMRTSVARYVGHPSRLAAHSLRAHLRREGVIVEGGVELVPAAPLADAVVLGQHESVPLSQLVAMINKPSSNFLADRLIRLVGFLRFGEATFGQGVRAMDEYLGRVGGGDGHHLENGSGLSYANHLSARQVVAVLLAGYADQRIATPFVASLAVAGRDGTLRGRFIGAASRGHVFAKTGTLTGISALSGYVTLDGKTTVCFAIISNDFRPGRKGAIRAGQAQLVEAMFRHVRRVDAAGVETPPEPPVEADAVETRQVEEAGEPAEGELEGPVLVDDEATEDVAPEEAIEAGSDEPAAPAP
jgi:D-alanyl-D-alanine carboxypeptidase/D-alanyl-D-alanine-endopeptidase (penicillin-binding protein 4)